MSPAITGPMTDHERKLFGMPDEAKMPDMVNHPPHYSGLEIPLAHCDTYGVTTSWIQSTFERGGKRWLDLKCLDVMRHIKDPRLATAFKYIWRVSLGGGKQGSTKAQDIAKAIVYLQDYLDNPVD